MESAIAYLRVSTQRQQRSGLGIEAQRATIARFGEAEELKIIAEYVEAKTGKGADARVVGLNSPQRWLPPSLRSAA
jgi:DNA invertase Pin-like site-specific DNA recombinase